ncbi:MAG: helix-turn-helix domain-containing protein [Treponema sp.]|nr:helix-turn-helix domain-containing protein [Treponema sp.]
MESLGEKLQVKREERDLTFEAVASETNITVKYLQALERGDFSVFPGEAYALGFLKSYGEFLEINPDDLMSLYRSQKIQEQPVPVDQLLKRPSRLPKFIGITVIAVAVLGLAVGAFYFIPHLPDRAPPPAQQLARASVEHTMTTDSFERRLFPGDSILVINGAESHRLVLASLGDAVTLSTPHGQVILDLGQEVTVNLGNNEFTELRIIAADFVKNQSASGALMRLEQITFQQATGILPMPAPPIEAFSTGREMQTILPSSATPYPFTLQAVFQDFCLFRYEVLFETARQGRSEHFYQRTQEVSVAAQNGIRLGISNARAVRLQVVGGAHTVQFEAGGAGEVIAADIRWIRDEDNRFRLVFIPLD